MQKIQLLLKHFKLLCHFGVLLVIKLLQVGTISFFIYKHGTMTTPATSRSGKTDNQRVTSQICEPYPYP